MFPHSSAQYCLLINQLKKNHRQHTPVTYTKQTAIYGFRFRKVKSQEGFDVHLQGGAGHCQLEAIDDIWMKHSKTPDVLSTDKDISTATGEKGGI